jgi:mono/diheme cytochrome c family protein
MYRFTIIWLIGLVLLLTGCGKDTATPTPEPTNTEAIIATATQPAEQVDPGRQVFLIRCASCHNLNSLPQVGPGLAGLFNLTTLPNGQDFSEEALVSQITQGGGAMQAVALSQDEIDVLIPFLREATAQ